MHGLMVLIVWAFLGACVEVCGAPAVSLSFGGKSKNDTGVVFAYRNGSWVSLGGGSKMHSVKSFSQVKKDERVNYTSELDDLFRRINLTLPRKMGPGGVKATARGSSEKPLGELFLEWLGKHEGTVRPVAAIKSTPIPVVGLQIDFDESPSARVTGRDVARVTSHPKYSLMDIPLLLGQPVRKTQKSYDLFSKSRVSERQQNSPLDRPINYYLEPEIAQVNQKGPNSDDDLKTQFYVRKRRGKNYVDDGVKFIIEPLTISPFDLLGSDLAGLSSNFHDVTSNLTKRDAKFSDIDTNEERRNLKQPYPFKHPQQDKKRLETQHLRHQRSYKDLFTLSPAKSQSAQPAQKMPEFDDALPVESHVKKRHDKLFLNPKTQDFMKALTPVPAAEESYSGQLLVRNEIPSDRKNKLNDLPKYVMKFLSQCKSLIEQNYDEDSAKDNDEDEEALLSRSNALINDTNLAFLKLSTGPTMLATHAAKSKSEVDEFETISINKKPIKKKSKGERGTIKLSIDNKEDLESDGWAQTGRSKNINDGQPKIEHKNLLSAYDGDDLYDEDLDFHIGDGNRQSDEKINRKMFFASDANVSTCRPIFEDYAPSTENYSPLCSEEPEVTTLSSEQWKILMDMLNERLPCPVTKPPTTCPTKKKTTTSSCTTQITCNSNGNGKMTSPRQKFDSGRNTVPKSTKNIFPKQNKPTTCQSTETTCASTTSPTTVATTSCISTSSTRTTARTCTTTCATTTCPTTTCPTTTTCATPTSEETTACDVSDTEAPTEDCSETPAPRNIKQKNKPAIPQRYLIKIETSKPKHFNELSHLQGRSKPNNWFDNIKNLKLLEGLRSNQNPMKLNYNPKNGLPGTLNDPDSPERMIAEGVIPLKTGSTLNLYISYVLNKTKAHKGKLPMVSNILDNKLPGASGPRKTFYDSKVHSRKR